MKMHVGTWKCTAPALVIALASLSPFRTMADSCTYEGITFNYYPEGTDGAYLQSTSDRPCIEWRTVGIVKIPDMVNGRKFTRIGDYAFNGCKEITEVIIPNTVTNIARSAFWNCESLAVVVLPDNLKSVEYGTFRNLGKMQEVILPDKVETIHDNAYQGCSGITNLLLNSSLKTIGASAFSGCSSLSNIVFGKSLASIGSSAFYGCSNLSEIHLPESVTNIGSSAFSQCVNVQSLVLAEGLETIPVSAFSGMSKVKEIDIPSSVKSISISASNSSASFWSWTSLESAAVKICDKNWTAKNLFPSSLKSLKSIVIKEGTRTIPASMFVGCEALESVVIPASVTRIGTNAFYDCSSLKQITFKGDAPYVEENAFLGTPRRMVISVPVNSIGWDSDASAATLPGAWHGHPILHSGDVWNGSDASGFVNEIVSKLDITVTNVVVHYIKTAAFANVVMPVSPDTGLVAVITEVKGGNFAVPDSWADNYPGFTEKFGRNFAAAMAKPTGKFDSSGNPLLVWHDYVCGTDPTDETDVFKASITMVDGEPVVSYTPELAAGQAALRKYTLWGKTSLTDPDWTEVQEGQTSSWNFFKVTVEMR